MKKDIHPKYQELTITCICGAEFPSGSTKENIRVEVCSQCHPFYTGKQRSAKQGGRVERFNRKYGIE